MDNNYTNPLENMETESVAEPEITEKAENTETSATQTEDQNALITPDLSLPLEEITAEGTYEEILEQRRHLVKPLNIFLFLISGVYLLFGIWDAIEMGAFSASFILSGVFFLIALSSRSAAKKSAVEDAKRGGHFTYRVFYNRIEYEYRIGDELHTFYRVDPTKITGARLLKSSLVFVYRGISFMIPRSHITEESLIYKAVMSSKNAKITKSSGKSKRRVAVIWLNICSIAIFCATAIVAAVAPLYAIPLAILSFFGIGLPIVSLSLMKGHKFRGRGLQIAASIILIIALFASFIAGIGVYDEAYGDEDMQLAENLLDRADDIIDIDFPDAYDAYMYEDEFYDPQSRTYIEYISLDCYLEDEDNEYMKSKVEGSYIWQTDMPLEMENFFYYVYTPGGDPFIVVNLTEGTLNSLPSDNSECEYVIIDYSYSGGRISICSFSLAYAGEIPFVPDSLSA